MNTGPINVLHILHSPVFGGPHNSTIAMDGWLRERGVTITVLLPTEADSAAERLQHAGVDVMTMPLHRMRATANPLTHLGWLRTFNTEVDAIVDLIRERQIASVVTTSLPNLHGGFAARRAGVSCVWKLVDSFPPPIARAAYMPFVRSMADVVVTTGLRIAQQHPGVLNFKDRWLSYYPPVDTARFSAREEVRLASRSELGLDRDDLVIGNVSNINPMKGHKYFIRAAADLLKTHPHARFVILGQQYAHFARYADQLWREAAVLGLEVGRNLIVRDPGTRVADLAQAFDLFWVTSEPRSEGIPTVIGEAKSLGLPVVAVSVGSVPEAVTTGVSGIVVQPRAPDQIARASRRILDHPELRASMSSAARREAELQFSYEHASAVHLEAYRRAIAVRVQRTAPNSYDQTQAPHRARRARDRTVPRAVVRDRVDVMNIVQVVTLVSADGAYGGPVTVAREQAAELAKRGHRVRLIAGWDGAARLEIPGVVVELHRAHRLARAYKFSSLFSAALIRAVASAARSADIVHVHMGRDLITLPAAILAERSAARVVIQTHGMVAPDTRVGVRALDSAITRRTLARAAAVAALTEEERDDLHVVTRSSVNPEILPNGVADRPVPSEQRVQPPVVGFCARLHPRKRVLAFAEMARLLIESGVDAQFVVAGPDEGDARRLQAYITSEGLGNRLKYIGALEPDHVGGFLAGCSVYVLPSEREPFPMTVLEAMAEGTPTVVTEGCRISNLLQSRGAALVTDGTPTQLAEAVSNVLSDSVVASRLQTNGQSLIASELGVGAICDRLEGIYRAAIRSQL